MYTSLCFLFILKSEVGCHETKHFCKTGLAQDDISHVIVYKVHTHVL